MKVIDSSDFPERDEKSFLKFLGYCREVARAKQRAQLVSISLRVKHIDPLAVLESIYEQDQLHFYLENPQEDIGIAGAEEVVGFHCAGPERFAKTKQFADDILDNTIAIGDLDCPLAGPHFFCGFTFSDEDTIEATGFAPATVFVPRWQVARNAGNYIAIANMLVEPESDLEPLAYKVLAAHKRFSGFNYSELADEPDDLGQLISSEIGEGAHYQNAVAQALENIAQDKYEKIVLARAVDIRAENAFAPLDILSRLRDRFASCFCYSFANAKGTSFIGASPERLVSVQGSKLSTEALAGSCARGNSVRQDARLARELLSSDKNLRENRMVVQSICKRLKDLGIEVTAPESPSLRKLANVQHLRIPVQGTIPEGAHILDVVNALHPTPAVGGRPRAKACPDIKPLEGFDRGLYAGVLGYFDAKGTGEMVVGIRSGLFQADQARLFAGAGIVDGSVPEDEFTETNLKLDALQRAIQ